PGRSALLATVEAAERWEDVLGERADEARPVIDDDRRDDAVDAELGQRAKARCRLRRRARDRDRIEHARGDEVAVVRLAVGVLVVVVTHAQLMRLLEQVDWELLGRDRVELVLAATAAYGFISSRAHARSSSTEQPTRAQSVR